VVETGKDGPSAILVGLDGSDSSYRATAYAAGLARRQHAKLVIAFIRPVPAGANASVVAEKLHLAKDIANDLRTYVLDQVARIPVEEVPDWEFIDEPGDPFLGLRAVADRLRADAVVIGASTKGRFRILGSVGVRLVRCGRWPVTIVP
jgi:nucleotide-binding universal stress UspA family protein